MVGVDKIGAVEMLLLGQLRCIRPTHACCNHRMEGLRLNSPTATTMMVAIMSQDYKGKHWLPQAPVKAIWGDNLTIFQYRQPENRKLNLDVIGTDF
jgi:hypothetical protein